MHRSFNVTHHSTATQRSLNFVGAPLTQCHAKDISGQEPQGRGGGAPTAVYIRHNRNKKHHRHKTKIYQSHSMHSPHDAQQQCQTKGRQQSHISSPTALMGDGWPQEIKIPLCTRTHCRFFPRTLHGDSRVEHSRVYNNPATMVLTVQDTPKRLRKTGIKKIRNSK